MEEILNKANYCLNCPVKPCSNKGCPLGNNIPGFIKAIKEEDYKKAYEILSETTVLEAVCGRICPHTKQCQGSCVRGIKSTPVSIGDMEAFIGDLSIKENYKLIIIVVVVTIIAMGIISATTLHYGIVIYDVKIKALVILIYVAIVIIFLKNVSEYNKIEKKIRNIVSGEYQSEIKTDNKYLKNMVQDINNIKKGIENAVNEKVKSERLKTDLITNVSHDLKTPLTSIINYANLLKKENIENENAQKYIEILENKSKKLKNLTEDLIEASKISSGNETVNLQKLNFAEMILQANGEFAEKYESKDLKLISKIEKEEIFAQLDSKKMWRVLENIYNNAYKHSLEGTRIYVNVEQNDKIVFTMKNISKEELNITPEELMERFVRGDKSRTSGGNGLRSFNS